MRSLVDYQGARGLKKDNDPQALSPKFEGGFLKQLVAAFFKSGMRTWI